MSSPSPNWGRWTLASIARHFEVNVADVYALTIHVEGQHKATNTLKEFFELRVDGPLAREQQQNEWKLIVEVNCLITTGMDDVNFYKHHLNCDRVTSGFANCIPCYKYGTEDDDDDSLLGIYQMRSPDDMIEQAHFGQINPAVQLQQSTVEGHYEMELSV